jgi:hypothetical protein
MTRRPTAQHLILALKLVSLGCSAYLAVARLQALRAKAAETTPEGATEAALLIDDGDSYVYVPDGRYSVSNAFVACSTCDGTDDETVVALDGDPVSLQEFNGYIADHELIHHSEEGQQVG